MRVFFFFSCTSVSKTSTRFFWPWWFVFFLYLSGESFLFLFFSSPYFPDTQHGESLKSLLSFQLCFPYPCLNKTPPGLNSGGHQALATPPSPPPKCPHWSAQPANSNEPPGRGCEGGREPCTSAPVLPHSLPVSGRAGKPTEDPPGSEPHFTFHKTNPARNVPRQTRPALRSHPDAAHSSARRPSRTLIGGRGVLGSGEASPSVSLDCVLFFSFFLFSFSFSRVASSFIYLSLSDCSGCCFEAAVYTGS